MNDLNLRVSGGIGEKVKKPATPLSMPYFNTQKPGISSDFFSNFINSKSADTQLKLLKQFLNNHKDVCEKDTIKFLVLLFWHADNKHPVKGFLKKHITDSRILRQPFTDTLTCVISAEISHSSDFYGDYIGTVTRLDACLDKFPPGASAISSMEVSVAAYYVRCLETCIRALGLAKGKISNIRTELAPTEINKIYDLVHLSLRLLLYMVQKVTDENKALLSAMFGNIRSIIAELMTGKEVPMDTKSVSGIIYLTMHLFENGPGSWIALLEQDRGSESGTVNLSVYSAVATVVSPAELVAAEVKGQPAVLDLVDKILAIGERYSSDPSHTLAVARTLLAISRSLSVRNRPVPDQAGSEPAGTDLAGLDGSALEQAGMDPTRLSQAGLDPSGPEIKPDPIGSNQAGLVGPPLARWCWSHLEHHMDSVRHLAAQLMGKVVVAAVQLQKQGDPSLLEALFASLSALDSSRKSFYVALTALAEAGADVVARRPHVLNDVIDALRTQAVQACATTFLETLLKRHIKESDTETIYRQWICVILETVKRESDPTVLGILERVLAKAVRWDSDVLEYILPKQRALSSYAGSDLKCILLVLGVVRKSGVDYKVTFENLRHTAYDADDEIRILSLSLVSETPRSTQPFSSDELTFTLLFLDYNLNAQSPSFRQLVLANMKKILKRLEDSHKVLKRKPHEHATEIKSYRDFASALRATCLDSLAARDMANYGRRSTALQLLSWLELLQLEDWERRWTEEDAEILYNLLEDSYENNKALALDILKKCPLELIKPVHSPDYVSAAIAQASSVRPTDCVAASYKLLLLLSLPLGPEYYKTEYFSHLPEPACFSLLSQLLAELRQQVCRARDILRAARDATMYGLVHCLARLLGCLDANSISGNHQWTTLILNILETCEEVNARVESVVTASSPEGLLPEDSHQADSSGGTRLADGRAVTAQMVLLCAWRSVKETSLLLGAIVSRLALEGEAPSWTLSSRQVERIGDHLITLLSTVKHRGAFEQAYVGFTLLLGRLWKCKSSLHQLPLQWFSSIERGFALPADGSTEYCATRRGAGLPFMIQALVTTELAAESSAPRGRLLNRCLDLCLSVARAPPGADEAARAHLVLRALYRHATPPADYTAEAIMVAVRGFEADTWTERNSSTLLFSALVVRVFGVARSGGHIVSPRNTMTGRIFFLRYPPLYDFLLEQLRSACPESTLRPSLFPALLLLARLYPSALEGTVSNLKLEQFLPHVVSLARARDVGTRRLAARAAAALVPHHSCVAHIQSLVVALGDPTIKRNLCHGLLCQLTVLLELKASLSLDERSSRELLSAVRGTLWIPQQPCFLIADEWLKFLNLVLMRFPKLLDNDLASISSLLEAILLHPAPTITSGRETFLKNLTYMLFIIDNYRQTLLHKIDGNLILIKCLDHKDYEVNLAALNYILILHGCKEDCCMFQEHLQFISKKTINIQNETEYVKHIFKLAENGYLECKQKALKVLMLSNYNRDIVRLKLKLGNDEISFETVINELIDSIRNGNRQMRAIYLQALLSFVVGHMNLNIVRVMYECSSAENDEETRETVVQYLDPYLDYMIRSISPENPETFAWWGHMLAAATILLEDDAPALRQRAGDAVLNALRDPGAQSRALAVHAGRRLRGFAAASEHAPALLPVLAALDFRAGVDTDDELGEECRVFDQNETHNVYLEEFTWSKECALELKRIHKQTSTLTIDEYLLSILHNPLYKDTIEELCIDNIEDYLMGRKSNPKIDLVLKILHE